MLRPRFLGRTGLADAVTVANGMIGFVACALVAVDVGLAARAILLAAVADGLDGVIARYHGKTRMGEYLDSLADVASFGVAPALLVSGAATVDATPGEVTPTVVAAVVVPALFVGMAVLRLGMYTAYDVAERTTEGVQTTLAATVLAAGYLSGATDPRLLLAGAGVLTYLMVTEIRYPELPARHALPMGAVQAGAIVVPTVLARAFPRVLLVMALGYLLLGPQFYRPAE